MAKGKLESPDSIKNGPLSAAFLSSAIGCSALGFFIVITEASPYVKNIMNFYNAVGPLSGKTTYAVAVWLLSWAFLHYMWKDKNMDFSKIFTYTVTLLIAGFIGSFPPFFELFTR